MGDVTENEYSEYEYEDEDQYIMSMTTIHANMIKTLFETLKDILGDVCIYFNKDGMKITSTDHSQVSLVYLNLTAEQINEGGVYSFNYHEPHFFIGVKLSTLFRIIKTISKGDKFSWFIHKNLPETLHIQLDDDTGSITTVFDYKLREPDEEVIEFPDLDYDYIFRIKSSDFAKRVKDMANIDIGDMMEIEVIENQMAISCSGMWVDQRTHIIGTSGSDTQNNSIEGKKSPVKIEFLKSASDKQNGKYKLKYLNIFTKASDLCEKNKIYFGHQKPLVIEYPVPNLGMLKFMLACEIDE